MHELSAPDTNICMVDQQQWKIMAMGAFWQHLPSDIMIAPLSIDLLLAAAYMLPLQQHVHESVCECICAVLLFTDAGETPML